MRVFLSLLLIAAPLTTAAAQDSTRRALPRPVDTLPHPPRPLNYFARSLLLPGWGQASLDRKLTGGLFIAFEGVALGMALKADAEIRYLARTGSERLGDKRAEREDWYVLVAFNHLFSALEAFVSAHLVDFPRGLRIQALPGVTPRIGISVPTP